MSGQAEAAAAAVDAVRRLAGRIVSLSRTEQEEKEMAAECTAVSGALLSAAQHGAIPALLAR